MRTTIMRRFIEQVEEMYGPDRAIIVFKLLGLGFIGLFVTIVLFFLGY